MKAKKTLTFGKWKVEPDGEMTFDGGRYWIEKERLSKNDWILHMTTKGWIDFNDFIPAYFQALENVGIPKVKILAYYE